MLLLLLVAGHLAPCQYNDLHGGVAHIFGQRRLLHGYLDGSRYHGLVHIPSAPPPHAIVHPVTFQSLMAGEDRCEVNVRGVDAGQARFHALSDILDRELHT